MKKDRLVVVLEEINQQFKVFGEGLVTAQKNTAELKQGQTEVKEVVDFHTFEIAILKSDVKVLKEDVKVLKEDVNVLKEDVKELKSDVKELKTDVSEIKDLLKAALIPNHTGPSYTPPQWFFPPQ